MAALSYFADIDPVLPQDCILHAAPLSHGLGLYGLPHVARRVGEVVVRGDVVMAGYWNQLRDRLRAETADGGSL